MISIAHKTPTQRTALATATLLFSHPTTHTALSAATNKKGDAMAVARIAAIQAAKQTATLIPLAHPGLGITGIEVDLVPFSGTERWTTHSEHTTRETSTAETRAQEAVEIPQESRTLTTTLNHGGMEVCVKVSCEGKTGVEMEALMGASVGALTLYDMLKGVDRGLVMMNARVLGKVGGKSGGWKWDGERGEVVRVGNEQKGGEPAEKEGEKKSAPERKGEERVMQVETEIEATDEAQNPATMTSTTIDSETDEWNEGLAREFSIRDEARREAHDADVNENGEDKSRR